VTLVAASSLRMCDRRRNPSGMGYRGPWLAMGCMNSPAPRPQQDRRHTNYQKGFVCSYVHVDVVVNMVNVRTEKMHLWVTCHVKWFMFDQVSSEWYSYLWL
jgi:hypothetical protein